MVAEDLPYSGPLQPDTSHVVVWDLNKFLQTEHPRMSHIGQFIKRHGAQSLDKLDCKQKHNGNETDISYEAVI